MSFLPLVGAGISAISSIAGGIAQGRNAAYQARVARNNAIIANENAQYAVAAGEAKATTQSLAGAQRLGQIKAAFGANQIDVNSGSAAKVEESQRETSQLDTMTTLNNALVQATGYRAAATSDTAEAGLLQTEAKQAPIGGLLSGAGGLLSGASGTQLGALFASSAANPINPLAPADNPELGGVVPQIT